MACHGDNMIMTISRDNHGMGTYRPYETAKDFNSLIIYRNGRDQRKGGSGKQTGGGGIDPCMFCACHWMATYVAYRHRQGGNLLVDSRLGAAQVK